jgi:hypothetical protein
MEFVKNFFKNCSHVYRGIGYVDRCRRDNLQETDRNIPLRRALLQYLQPAAGFFVAFINDRHDTHGKHVG